MMVTPFTTETSLPQVCILHIHVVKTGESGDVFFFLNIIIFNTSPLNHVVDI